MGRYGRGLRAEYFHRRDFNRERGLVYEQVDPAVDFDFGFEAGSFDIRRLVVDIMVVAASPAPGSVP